MNVSSATWRELSGLLDEALDLEPPQRAAWLQRQRTARPDLTPSLEQLLAAHASAETDDALARLPGLGPPAQRASSDTGFAADDRIGPYRLIRELGCGGMADVWLAERDDGAFARRVALKLPRVTRLRRDLAQRFARERDILARLEHPNIARLYDAGMDADGLPYLAMEYVDGQPITAWCDAQRLGLAARLPLFLQVLDAVQYAHASLVIHRDLKPSNILVTAGGQVRLLDFGIAKLIADDEQARETQLTRLAGRAFTPDYASPEQVRGAPLTTATDVYSAGVVLYELLCGQRPYRLAHATAAQLEAAILGEDAARPSTRVDAAAAAPRATTARALAHALGGDLDTIVLKALAKEPALRYPTIGALAADLQRHLAGEPVQARPASVVYRTGRFVSRNRIAVGAAAAIAAILVGATAVSLWQAQLARAQAQRAEQVKRFVLSIFESADISAGSDRKTTAVDLLRKARERIATSPVADPAITVELLTSIGFSLVGLGEYQSAMPVLAEASQLAVKHLGHRHPVTANALMAYGEVLILNGDAGLAAPAIEAAEATMRDIGEPTGLVNALRWKAHLRVEEGRFDEAIAAATEAVKLSEASQPLVGKRAVMLAHWTLATAMSSARATGHLPHARRAYELARELAGVRVTPDLLGARALHANAMVQEGDPAEGLSELKAVVEQQVEQLGPNHADVARTRARIGAASLTRGDPETAIASYGEFLRIEIATNDGRATIDRARAHMLLGMSLANARRWAAAESELRQASLVFAATGHPDGVDARIAQAHTAWVVAQLGRLDEAEAVFAQLLARPSGNLREAATVKARLAMLRNAQGRHAEALELIRAAEEFFARGPIPTQRAAVLVAKGAVQLDSGQASEALVSLRQASSMLDELQPGGSPDRADLQVILARTHLALGNVDAAIAAAAEATAFWQRFDPVSRAAGLAHLWLCRSLLAAGRAGEAAEALRDAGAALADSAQPADRDLLERTQRDAR
jgi:serine/threonine-protein kinase